MRKRTYIYIYIYVYYTYNRVAWLYSRNWPSIVNQLDFNKKKICADYKKTYYGHRSLESIDLHPESWSGLLGIYVI